MKQKISLILFAAVLASTAAFGRVIFQFPVTDSGAQIAMAIADFDGDRDQDLVFLSAERGQLAILENDGSGDFSPRVISTMNFPSSRSKFAISASDIDTDGDVDIIFADTSRGVIKTFLNDGRGNFRP
ncbi:MAG: FG-GAP repeat domain-containing protein [Oligoflexales bacterium]